MVPGRSKVEKINNSGYTNSSHEMTSYIDRGIKMILKKKTMAQDMPR